MTASIKSFTQLAEYASDSPRIKQAIEQGLTNRAVDLLIVRMSDVMLGFVNGDSFEDPELFRALNYINDFPGPAGKFLLGLAASRQVEIMVLEYMMEQG